MASSATSAGASAASSKPRRAVRAAPRRPQLELAADGERARRGGGRARPAPPGPPRGGRGRRGPGPLDPLLVVPGGWRSQAATAARQRPAAASSRGDPASSPFHSARAPGPGQQLPTISPPVGPGRARGGGRSAGPRPRAGRAVLAHDLPRQRLAGRRQLRPLPEEGRRLQDRRHRLVRRHRREGLPPEFDQRARRPAAPRPRPAPPRRRTAARRGRAASPGREGRAARSGALRADHQPVRRRDTRRAPTPASRHPARSSSDSSPAASSSAATRRRSVSRASASAIDRAGEARHGWTTPAARRVSRDRTLAEDCSGKRCRASKDNTRTSGTKGRTGIFPSSLLSRSPTSVCFPRSSSKNPARTPGTTSPPPRGGRSPRPGRRRPTRAKLMAMRWSPRGSIVHGVRRAARRRPRGRGCQRLSRPSRTSAPSFSSSVAMASRRSLSLMRRWATLWISVSPAREGGERGEGRHLVGHAGEVGLDRPAGSPPRMRRTSPFQTTSAPISASRSMKLAVPLAGVAATSPSSDTSPPVSAAAAARVAGRRVVPFHPRAAAAQRRGAHAVGARPDPLDVAVEGRRRRRASRPRRGAR